MKTIELRLPNWMACPLINGDTSGIDDPADETKLDKLESWLSANGCGGCLDVADETEFQAPSFDSINIYGESLAGGFATYVFPVIAPTPRKGTLEAKLMEYFGPDLSARYKVIAYELTHDRQGWSVNTPFCIASETGIAGLLESLRGRWEVYRVNYDSRARVSGISDISDEDGAWELEAEQTPFARVERLEA